LCGVLFVGALVASFAVSGSSPGVKATGQHVISFFTTHRGAQQAGAYLGMYAAVFFLFFAAVLRGHIRRMAPGSRALAAMSFGGALVFAVGGAVNSGLYIALSDAPGSARASS
jgi:hypothetical protein